MNATLTVRLQHDLLGPKSDLEQSMGLVSAIREVAEREGADNFAGTRQAYLAVAGVVVSLAECVGGEFADAYRLVAQNVMDFAGTLPTEEHDQFSQPQSEQ